MEKHYKDHLKATVVNSACMLEELFEQLLSFWFVPQVRSAVTTAASLWLVVVDK